jgi:hypothetical protein
MILAPKVCSARPATGRALTVGTIVNQRMGGGKAIRARGAGAIDNFGARVGDSE